MLNLSQRQQVSTAYHVEKWSVPRTSNKVSENLTNNKGLIITKHRNVLPYYMATCIKMNNTFILCLHISKIFPEGYRRIDEELSLDRDPIGWE